MTSYELERARRHPNYVEPTLEGVNKALREEVAGAKAAGKPTWISAYAIERQMNPAGPTNSHKVRRLLNEMATSSQGMPGSVIKWDWKAHVEGPTRNSTGREQHFSLLGEDRSARDLLLERSQPINTGQTVKISGIDWIHGGEQVCEVLDGTDEDGNVTLLMLVPKLVFSGDVTLLENPDGER